jgi:hypothetical protein
LAASIAGYAFKPIGVALRVGLLALSMIVFFTRWQEAQLVAQLVAAGLILVALVLNYLASRKIEPKKVAI